MLECACERFLSSLSYLIQLYNLAGECPEVSVYIFIHQGMPRGIMYPEDVRGEGPRRRISSGLV